MFQLVSIIVHDSFVLSKSYRAKVSTSEAIILTTGNIAAIYIQVSKAHTSA